MSGDPVEESSQAMRNGFVQALQTAHTTAALMRGRGGESRSKSESDQRVRLADAKDRRSFIEHRLRVIDAGDSAGQTRQLNTAKVDEVRARIERGGEAHQMDQWQTWRQIQRADADLNRRNKAGKSERKQSAEIHDAKVGAYTNREAREAKLHELDVELKQLMIKIRRRAAGFEETLTSHGESGEAMASAAAHAAAKGAEGLSEQHRRAAEAFDERFAEDTGTEHTEFIGPLIPTPGAERADSDIIDATVVEDFDFVEPNAPAMHRDSGSVSIEDVTGLTEELSFATHLAHEFSDLFEEPDSHPQEDGTVIGEAVDAAGLNGESLTDTVEFAVDVELPPMLMLPAPDVGLEP
ncbi:hypothetical protein OHB12_04765 [Nocardia sp. NBC_01730]|uniref:hypothetical protein n=1 Tax=Nocardia sp. NBC_01730 TaxID=2975998 RepID=UPI002E1558D7|nr:hypothetical protein OHB12_04765 [Nocardia sp. NBC_01730]